MNYCPRCGTKLDWIFEGGRDRPGCSNEGCGFLHFGDNSIGCGAVVIRDGKSLLIQRGIEPNRGAWQLPGGYVECDEQIITAMEREILEEAGIIASVSDVIGFRHSPGMLGGPAANIYVVFRLEFISGEPTFDGDETIGAGFFSIEEMASMERVQTLSTWAIHQALSTGVGTGLTRDDGFGSQIRAGWSLFGLTKGEEH